MLPADGLVTNEDRADLGTTAAQAVAEQSPWQGMRAVTTIEDTLTYLAHACDRFGLPPAETFRGALRRYRMHIEEGTPAVRIADGETSTLEEGNDANSARGRRAPRRNRAGRRSRVGRGA